MTRFIRKLGYWLRRDRRAAELAEEMEFHRSMAERDALDQGTAPSEAKRAASLQAGNETLERENSYNLWSFPTLESIAQDVRYAVRVLKNRFHRHRDADAGDRDRGQLGDLQRI